MTMTETHTNTSTTEKKTNPHIMDYLLLWAQNKKSVFLITFLCAAGFLVITYLMPQTYSSMASIMPPEKDKTSGVMSFLSGSGALDLMKGHENPQMDMFKNILDSRFMSEMIAGDSLVKEYFSRFDTSFNAIAFFARSSLTSDPLRNG